MLTIGTIKKRASCRTYKKDQINEEGRQKLRDFLRSNVRGPFGNGVRFELVDLAGKEQDEIRTLGTYGFIRGASTFIVGAVGNGDRAMEDYGYCMERNILTATHLGLGTCWLGGIFNRSASALKIHKRGDEVVPAITPVGYPCDRKSIMENAVRFFAKSNNRKAWEELFFCEDTKSPLTNNIAGDYALPLECVRIGPSASNRQPWRVVKKKDADVFPNETVPASGVIGGDGRPTKLTWKETSYQWRYQGGVCTGVSSLGKDERVIELVERVTSGNNEIRESTGPGAKRVKKRK